MPPVTITYTLHPSPSVPLQSALTAIRASLPLRNLHWKSSSRTAIRTIQEVEVNLVELGDVGPSTISRNGSVLEAPLVNLCLVVCDDSDTYKNSTRSFIRDWLSLLAARRNVHTPLIVLVNPASSAASSGKNVFGRDKGVLGKLKTDFNVGKRDRCVQVNLPPEGKDDPAAWPEVINRIKESVVVAFDAAVLEREEEVKRGESQRMMVGWNFCTWFLLKESLATSFESVLLPEDALVIYEELEATFFQILKEQNLSWFGKLGATGPQDDSLPVLDVRAKNYTELLQGSAISIFDFRVYLFARQSILLGKLGRITEIAKRGEWFVASLTRRLRENEADLAEHFIESWTYTACMDIVQRCDEWSQIDRPNGDYSGLVAYESARSELLDIARVQVERIGVACNHLPDAYPFSPASSLIPASDDVLFSTELDDEPEVPETGDQVRVFVRQSISNRQLLEAKADAKVFRNLYLTLTKRAIMAYEACDKTNSVVRLKADLAALALYTQEWTVAYDLCRALAKYCAERQIWDPIAKFALEGALRSHREFGQEKDEEWCNLALAYLRLCVLPHSQGTTELPELSHVLHGLQMQGSHFEVPEHMAFGASLLVKEVMDSEEPDEDDLVLVPIEVINRLPMTIQIDQIAVDLVKIYGTPHDAEEDHITFQALSTELQPGRNVINVKTDTSVDGRYAVRKISLLRGPVAFTYHPHDHENVLRLRRPRDGVSVRIMVPHHIALDTISTILVELRARKSGLTGGSLRLASDDAGLDIDLASAVMGDKALDFNEEGVQIPDMGNGEICQVSVPYTGTPRAEVTSIRIGLSYRSPGADRGGYKEYRDVQAISLGLPLTVNVQDFFRPDYILSHFTIASDGKDSLQVDSVQLVSKGGGHTVESSKKQKQDRTVITPTEPLSCVFKIRKSTSEEGESSGTASAGSTLWLVIRYSTIHEELERQLNVVSSHLPPSIRKFPQSRTREPGVLEAFARTGELATVFDERWRSSALASIPGVSEKDIADVTMSLSNETVGEPQWRTLEIPVEVPSQRILTTVKLVVNSPSSASGKIYEGRAISLSVQMSTSTPSSISSSRGSGSERDTSTASGSEREEDGPRMVFDILANPEDWLILGRKKGYYQVRETTEIVLVPMRPGSIPLPGVTVNLLPTPGSLAEPGPGPGLLCETFVVNAAESIEVYPAKGVVTTLVPLEAAWEVEAERRA